jgi:ABC-2 type transport system ATP-binding protein
MDQPAIKLEGLTKYYGKQLGVRDLNFEIEAGEIFGFLGPNGAGKTTTIRLLLDLLRATRGRAFVLGLESRANSLAIRQRIGVVPGELRLYEQMSGERFLNYLAGFTSHPPSLRAQLLDTLQFDRVELKRVMRHYSRGMKQKLGIVQAMQHDPELLILDEPTEGLDPLVQQSFYGLLRDFRRRGRTVFMSSHILSEVEHVCDRVAIIRQGVLVELARVADLIHNKVRKMEVVFSREVTPQELEVPDVTLENLNHRRAVLAVKGSSVGALIKRLGELGVEDLVFGAASLEEAFLDYYRGDRAPGKMVEHKPTNES